MCTGIVLTIDKLSTFINREEMPKITNKTNV